MLARRSVCRHRRGKGTTWIRGNCCVKNVRFNYCKQWSAMQTRPSCSCLDAMANSADFFFYFPLPISYFLISPSRFMPMFRWRKSGAINNRTLISPWLHVPQLSLTYVKKKEERKERNSTRTNTKREKKLNKL